MTTEDKTLALLTYVSHISKKELGYKNKKGKHIEKGDNNYKNTQEEINLGFKFNSRCAWEARKRKE